MLNVDRYFAPDGAPIVGTAETVKATALITGIKPNGEPEYDGSVEVDWDSSTTVLREGKKVFLDDRDREWTFDQLVKVEA